MPAGKTYIKIASQTVSGSPTTVTFSNLPQNYTDLVLVVSAKDSRVGNSDSLTIQFNGDTGSNYSNTELLGNGTAASSTRSTSQTYMRIGDVGGSSVSEFGTCIVQFMNYSNGNIFKTVIGRGSVASEWVRLGIALWRSTSPITSISIPAQGGAATWTAGSVFTLYGIEAAKSPKATGGDKIYTTGTHWVHEFYNSGLFVPQVALTADYLVVAGGGGGGGTPADAAGGGGAGGLRSTVTATGGGGSLESSLSLTGSIGYTVIVGGGGAGGISGNANDGISGINGSNSSISGSNITTITSTGGGGGARGTNDLTAGGNTGGSGGGGSARSGSSGSGTANQGYAGGSGGSTSAGAGGGGGGAGAVGENGSGGNGGNGGTGVSIAITGVSKFYAGGGGGGCSNSGGSTSGTGGSGGGGGGNSANSNGVAATSNTGGGGGAAARNSGGGQRYGGNGGSGIVIVRYAV